MFLKVVLSFVILIHIVYNRVVQDTEVPLKCVISVDEITCLHSCSKWNPKHYLQWTTVTKNQQKYALAWKFWPCQCSTNNFRNVKQYVSAQLKWIFVQMELVQRRELTSEVQLKPAYLMSASLLHTCVRTRMDVHVKSSFHLRFAMEPSTLLGKVINVNTCFLQIEYTYWCLDWTDMWCK